MSYRVMRIEWGVMSDENWVKSDERWFFKNQTTPKDCLFYNHKDNKVFVSTNAKFLENDYANNFNPRSKVVLAEIDDDGF